MRDFVLSVEHQSQLRCQLKQQASAHVYRRAAALLALHQGHSAGQVASLFGVTRQTIYNWVSTLGRANPDLNLEDAPRPGRPSVWTEELDLLLKQALQASPTELGYVVAHWSAPLLRQHLVVSQLSELSEETIRRRLRRLGYTWTDGRYVRQSEPDTEPTVLDTPNRGPGASSIEDKAIAA